MKLLNICTVVTYVYIVIDTVFPGSKCTLMNIKVSLKYCFNTVTLMYIPELLRK